MSETTLTSAVPPEPNRPSTPDRPRRPTASLRTRLLAAFLLVTLIPLGLIVFANERTTRTALTEAAYRSLSTSASRAALSVDAFIGENLTMIGMEAKLPVLADYLKLTDEERAQPPAVEDVRAVLTALSQRDKVFIDSYALLDAHGRNLMDTSPVVEPDESSRSYFSAPHDNKLPYVSPVEFLPAGVRACLYFSSPVVDASGTTLGVLRVRYNAAVLQRIIVESSGILGPGSFAMLFDDQHMLLAHGLVSPTKASAVLYSRLTPPSGATSELLHARRIPPGALKVVAEPELLEGLANLDSDRPYFPCELTTYGSEHAAAAVARTRTQPWVVAFFLPRKVLLAPVEAETRLLLYVSFGTVLLVIVTASVAARSLSRPIMQLTRSAEQLAKGHLSTTIEVTSKSEIGVLEATFARMAGDIQRLVDDLNRRNAELNTANAALKQQNQLLEEEIGERARAEAILREQQEAIRLLSTPILAVWEDVLALPVIGVVDAGRAAQMMEKLLDEIVRRQASVAILDLTGVDRVDHATAGYLLNIIRSANLLGSKCVLSGISPEIARAMVDLEIGADFTTFNTLQGALRYALRASASRKSLAR